ncbi:hypothetical protein SMSP2_02963 [Limihaloglobus sulfuriphilus]|uniref:Uncharacterized protein n=1 Tax=Limihaloglobus sulfuriphilus TaxID=1851148 RepID=A0A1R7T6A1_9BACT|nr:hypothetical protein [Limihaloglobus sulfuriphilus]AQQ72573.1 hypothetical protein SMSP2_02963 [Limihaloglobus sulfuriphilus]
MSDIYISDKQSTNLTIIDDTVIDTQSLEKNKKKFTATLLQLIHDEIFEYGTLNSADSFVRESLKSNKFVKEWINEIFLKHFSNIEIITGILKIISHITYSDIYPTGQTMAIAALSHKDIEVKECGIRAFENWDAIDSIDLLKKVDCQEEWLVDYLEEVISYLEECREHTCKKN